MSTSENVDNVLWDVLKRNVGTGETKSLYNPEKKLLASVSATIDENTEKISYQKLFTNSFLPTQYFDGETGKVMELRAGKFVDIHEPTPPAKGTTRKSKVKKAK